MKEQKWIVKLTLGTDKNTKTKSLTKWKTKKEAEKYINENISNNMEAEMYRKADAESARKYILKNKKWIPTIQWIQIKEIKK